MPPAVPIGVPSDVLERRPDVASAERAMAAANAQIGVANAAFYPSIILGGTLGDESRVAADAVRRCPASSGRWARRSRSPCSTAGGCAPISKARARTTTATVANYRRVVLTAMQEVEDGITGLAALERAHAQAQVAIASATRVLDLATSRYEGGVATYLDVITAQQGLLEQRAPGRATAGPAAADRGVPGQGAGRRLAGRGDGREEIVCRRAPIAGRDVSSCSHPFPN